MGFWFLAFLWIGFTIIGELLRPKPKFGAPQPSSLGDFSLPTAQEGRAVPVVVGTVKLGGANVTWYGDLLVRAIKKKVKTGFFSSTKVTTGYRYFMGAQLALCHGEVDELLEVRMDDRVVPFATPVQELPPTGDVQTGSWSGRPFLPGGLYTFIDDIPGGQLFGGGSPVAGPNDVDYITVSSDITSSYEASFGTLTDPGTLSGYVIKIRARYTGPNNNNSFDQLLLRQGANILFDGGTLPNRSIPAGSLTTYFKTFVIPVTLAMTPASFTGWKLLWSCAGGGTPGGTVDVSWCRLYAPAVSQSLTGDPVVALFNSPNQFGGEEREGGVVGRMDFYRGTLTQLANDYLQSAIGASLPAYKGICYAVLRQMYLGTSPYLKAISFVLRRTPNQLALTGGAHNISGDANPACVLYEFLTNDRWGLGLTTAFVDVPSFEAAGYLLAAESFGVSMIFDSASSARALLAEVLRHVDGVIYTDPASGKLRLKLARADYGPGDPLLLSPDNVENCKITRPSWADLKNNIKVGYVDRANNFQGKVAQAQDLAAIQVRGEVSTENFDYRGVSNGALAQRVAARELKTTSYPLAVVELEGVSRQAWAVQPGGVVRLTWPAVGVSDMVCRVTRVSQGHLKDGRIRIDAVEDVFGVAATGYVAPGTTAWVDPITSPTSLSAVALLELPYALVVGPDRLVATMGAQGSTATLGYEVWADNAGGSSYALASTVRELTPSTLLASDFDYADTTMIIRPAPGVSTLETAVTEGEFEAGRNVLLVNNELVAWQTISDLGDGTFMIGGCVRGVADTTPARHGAGQRLWFLSEGSGLTSAAAYLTDVTVAAKLLAFTSVGTQSLSSVSATSLTTNSRAQRPYVPANVKINDVAYPNVIGTGDVAVTWAHRNRLTEWLWATAGVTGSPEPGTTYNLRFYGDADTLLKTYSGLTGTSQTWTTELTDTPGGVRNQKVRVELEAVVSSVVSYQKFNFTTFRLTGFTDPAQPSQMAAAAARVRRRRRRVFDTGAAE